MHIALRATEDQRDALKGIALAKKMTMQALLSGFIDKLIDRETNRTKS